MAAQSLEAPEPGPRPTPGAPQLRTLLLTDLVDSTGLVERLGDGPASELFRAHDRMVLQLQQQWRGRLIDRSDGLLLLFERPIDGLGFALDYVRGLDRLGAESSLKLQARAGLHVGEVLTWRNSDEAVSVGAKPLEVEGLAKPMAARLMAMARPGQILVSAVAEPLAHRAARELGERGQHLLWKSHGRWRFKGVPEAQQIFEVGEPGVAPLRIPPNSPKAWRDVPLWRRPMALAAEIALVLGATAALWFIGRPAPAIAFSQRDWVVVGDLRNLTGQTALDDSLEQAFRISLEQSRHVNVLSDLKARDTLGRMQRPADTVLDRAIASEIALRDGARAVILPTVAEVGGRVRVSAEVIDPRTQTTVYAQSADGQGVESALSSIDSVTAALRADLGEAVKAIETDSEPLPQVTTANLDALRAYALGQKAFGRSQYPDALRFYQRATQLDPRFALAWIGQMRVKVAEADTAAAIAPLRQAEALRDHLAPREAMYLDAWRARFEQPAQVTEKWVELAKLYPDFGPALSNASHRLGVDNRHREALAFATRAAKAREVDVAIDYDTIGRAQLVLGDYASAARAFDQAIAGGYTGSLRRQATVAAARRDFASAERLLHKVPADDPYGYLERTSLALDRGQWAQAQALSDKGLSLIGKAGFDAHAFHLPAAVADWRAGDNARAREHAQAAVTAALAALAQPLDPDAEGNATVALVAALLGLRLEQPALAVQVLAALESRADLMAVPNVRAMTTVLRAERKRRDGDAAAAIALLEPMLGGNEQVQTRVALMEAYVQAHRGQAALAQAHWLQERRGQAYGEVDCGYCRQALNIVDSNAAAAIEKQVRGTGSQGAGRAGAARTGR
ncbi:putative peptide modification system cyclase [Agrilutibacter solisilvae]|uniref:Peptide modification system cyclase n=1 Tax=Agrilutibacter solisilvae TaxID=2763317 RepID=A0A974Y1Y6_9GAMM|nr:putative peptide modification system cyclase [Lysobacter solisilvae]QSX79038.1 putative peptide modification system cyclase [Lysobacter solisilvae]